MLTETYTILVLSPQHQLPYKYIYLKPRFHSSYHVQPSKQPHSTPPFIPNFNTMASHNILFIWYLPNLYPSNRQFPKNQRRSIKGHHLCFIYNDYSLQYIANIQLVSMYLNGLSHALNTVKTGCQNASSLS